MRRLLSAGLAALALLSACAAPAAPASPDALAAPGEAPLVRGPIERITHHATASGLLVRAGPGSRERCGILATVDARTRLLRRDAGGTLRAASLAELEPGDLVEVYVDGPVAESCPVQGRASAVVRVG